MIKSPKRIGSTIGGTSHSDSLALAESILTSSQKKSPAGAGLSSAQKGKLLLWRLLGAWLAIALVLLRGRLDLARRDGLGGFIGGLFRIGHKYFLK